MKIEIFAGKPNRVKEEFNHFCKDKNIEVIKLTSSPISDWDGKMSVTLIYRIL